MFAESEAGKDNHGKGKGGHRIRHHSFKKVHKNHHRRHHRHRHHKRQHRPKFFKHKITKEDFLDAKQKFILWKKNVNDIEKQLKEKHKGNKGHLHIGSFRRPKFSARRKGEHAEAALIIAKEIAKKKHLSKKELELFFAEFHVDDTFLPHEDVPECNKHSKYRTIDGSCNNLKHPTWGQAETAFNRLLHPAYDDVIDAPRQTGKHGHPLPLARVLSRTVATDSSHPHSKMTTMFMQFGQFLDHDFTKTPVTDHGTDITCCDGLDHPDCFPISIPHDDGFYGQYSQTCMDFVRSLPAPRKDGKLGFREQLNEITAYIDGSNIYGSDEKEAKELREFTGGKLRVQNEGETHLLPAKKADHECPGKPNRPCFLAGDGRVNEQPNLVIMHTLWMRQHNNIVKGLSKVNPHWDDEKLYQEGRRIVAAQLQHIVYNEWLPNALGKHAAKQNDLLPAKKGYTYSYNPHVDATIFNEFATAGFRFGHSTIQPEFLRLNKYNEELPQLDLSKHFFEPSFLYDPHWLDQLTRGLAEQNIQQMDNHFPQTLTNKLFNEGKDFGMDLIALNTQRGRDHGLAPYVEYRKLCGLSKPHDFHDLEGIMKPSVIHKLKKVYKDVEDMDLFIAAVSEKPTKGALVGPTLQCLLVKQFSNLKFGDRFYYENGHDPHTRFTEEQLNDIKKTKLSSVVCHNSDEVRVIQGDVFHIPSYENYYQYCDHIPQLNFHLWQEHAKCPHHAPHHVPHHDEWNK